MSMQESNIRVAIYVRKFSEKETLLFQKEIKRKYVQKLLTLMTIGI